MNDVQPLIYDDGRGRFGPLTRLRPVFELITGAMSNRARLEAALGGRAALMVQPPHVEIMRERETDASVNAPITGPVRCFNGRWSGASPILMARAAALALNHALAQRDGQVIAAHLSADDAQRFVEGGCAALPAHIEADRLDADVLLDRPWHIHDQLDAVLRLDLSRFPQRVAGSARVHAAAVIDEREGPVVIDEGADVGPLAVLQGPCYVGPRAQIKPHTNLRPRASIAHDCKVGGEVSAAILHEHTNKAHAGYLGNAIVGAWCNLGADTTVSNLKNTYGEVRVQLDAAAPPEPTGRVFLGPTIGDFVRTAIGSRLLTGSCIGLGCCLAMSGFAPKFADDLGFYTDTGREPYELERFLESVNRAMARRDLSLPPAVVAQIARCVG